MSTFDILQSRIAQSAKAAAGAARQLSSLDDMAQNDDYVHSEGLRLSSTKKISSSASLSSSVSDNSSDLPSVVEDLSGKFVNALSLAAARKQHRSPTRPSPAETTDTLTDSGMSKISSATNNRAHTKKKKSATPNNMQLMKSVAALYDETANEAISSKQLPKKEDKISASSSSAIPRGPIPSISAPKVQRSSANKAPHSHFLQELEYESDTDSSDDDEQPKKPQNDDIEMTRPSESSSGVEMLDELESGLVVKKDVHRFMKMTSQLESEREVLIQSQKSRSGTSTSTTNPDRIDIMNGSSTTAGDDTYRALRAGLSWIRNVASPQLESFSKQLMSKISDPDGVVGNNKSVNGRKPMIGPRHATPHTRNNDCQDDEIIVSTSAAFLGAQDTAELERIRMKHSASWMTVLLQNCIDNPRLLFIAATLVIALFAYFYSRHRSVDDVL